MAVYRNCPCCTCVEDGCCDECVDCSAAGDLYDANLVITSTSQSGSISGSKSVRGCAKRCGSACTKVAPEAGFRFRVQNQTSRDVTVQFQFTISGLGSCSLIALYNCAGPGTYSNGGPQNWFYVEVPAGSTLTGTLDHYISGVSCCNQSATITGFTYQTSEGFANPGCTDPEYYNDGGSGCVTPGDCTFYAMSEEVTLACASCGSGFADYIVTNIECLGGGECRYTLDFNNCT